jgi:hypothetical protein
MGQNATESGILYLATVKRFHNIVIHETDAADLMWLYELGQRPFKINVGIIWRMIQIDENGTLTHHTVA